MVSICKSPVELIEERMFYPLCFVNQVYVSPEKFHDETPHVSSSGRRLPGDEPLAVENSLSLNLVPVHSFRYIRKVFFWDTKASKDVAALQQDVDVVGLVVGIWSGCRARGDGTIFVGRWRGAGRGIVCGPHCGSGARILYFGILHCGSEWCLHQTDDGIVGKWFGV